MKDRGGTFFPPANCNIMDKWYKVMGSLVEHLPSCDRPMGFPVVEPRFVVNFILLHDLFKFNLSKKYGHQRSKLKIDSPYGIMLSIGFRRRRTGAERHLHQ